MSDAATTPETEPNVTVTAAVTTLLDVDCGSCGFVELDVLSAAAQRLRGFLTAAEARIARRRDELWTIAPPVEPDHSDPAAGHDPEVGSQPDMPSGHPDPSDTPEVPLPSLDSVGGTRDRRSASDAARDTARGRTGAAFPAFESALAAGRIDAAHLDAIAVALERLSTDESARARLIDMEAALLDAARTEAPERFRRRCLDLSRRLAADHGIAIEQRQRQRASIRRWWNRRTGMYHVHAELDPESGAKVESALDAALDTRRAVDTTADPSWQRLEVESFVEVMTTTAATEARTPEVVVHIDLDTLVTGVFAPDSICETSSGAPLSPTAVRRMACDAGLVPVVLNGTGLPLDVGRTRRLATAAQRSALRALHRTCAHPECAVRFSRCRIHHLDPWERGGATDLGRLVPLCERHHHLVHEGGWRLGMNAERLATWRRPDGTVWYEGDTSDRSPPGCGRRLVGGGGPSSPDGPVP